VRVIRRLEERGLSSAIVEGFASSGSRYMVAMDADLQHDIKTLQKFLEAFREGNDIVVGSRKTEGGGISEWSNLRRFASWTATQLANLVVRNNVSDPMSGFFGLTKEHFESISSKVDPRGFKLLLDILAKSPKAKIKEIGYIFHSRIYGKSKLNTNVILDYFIALYTLSLGKYIPLRFVKYSLIGLSGVAVNQGGLFLGKSVLQFLDSQSILLGIELSIISNYLLNNFWTFADYRHRGWSILGGMISFHIVSLAGAVINLSAAMFLSSQFELNLYLANLAGIALATIWNYRINFQMTWKHEL